MKLKHLLLPISLTLLLSSLTCINQDYIEVNASSNYVVSTNGCSSGKMPTYLDLNSSSEDEIRSYYSSLNSLSNDERSGKNVLSNLKSILFNMNYYSYAQVSDIYAITDRDWINSPTLTSGTYNSNNKTVSDFSSSKEATSNPYIKMLYVDYSKIETTPLLKEDKSANFDKEHVWCQSRGFKADSGAKGPAGTDLHNLIAGDSFVNRQIHNNNPYGFVDTKDKEGELEYTKENVRGSILHKSNKDESNVVFEPMDEYKGDVARAIFYMAARYNNISGNDTITQFEPNLTLVNYATSNGENEESSASKAVGIGILSDLLAWHHLDPVSDHEIYRNDLIYRNYQGNRNPFIDFPTWVDAIWGSVNNDGTNYNETPVGVINPLKDSINDRDLSLSTRSIILNKDGVAAISAKTRDNSDISWRVIDSNIVNIDKTVTKSDESLNITALSIGTTKLIAKANIDGIDIEISVDIEVKEKGFELSNEMLIIGGAILAFIILIIIIVIYIKSNKKNKKKIEKVIKKTTKNIVKSKKKK